MGKKCSFSQALQQYFNPQNDKFLENFWRMFETFCLRIAGKRFLKWWQFNNTKFKGPEIEPSLDARKWFWARRISCFLPSTSSQLPFPSHPSDASESLPLICSTRFDEKPWARACCFSCTRCLKEKVSPYRRVRWNPNGKVNNIPVHQKVE